MADGRKRLDLSGQEAVGAKGRLQSLCRNEEGTVWQYSYSFEQSIGQQTASHLSCNLLVAFRSCLCSTEERYVCYSETIPLAAG